ncbi:MAG: hypothetical protein LJE74_10485 [Proteobacteria bacterium]|jgi:uncharacterized protein|nr:hypothetical protein [Pseudomonadota bacterium]
MAGLIRVAIIVILAVLAYRLIKRWLANQSRNSGAAGKDKIGQMVRCHHCGLHIPQDEALRADNHWYCNQEHRKLDHDAR